MFKYNFSYDNILTPSEIKNRGILFDDVTKKHLFQGSAMSCSQMEMFTDIAIIMMAIKKVKMLISMIMVLSLNIRIIIKLTQQH